jgi:hypothetical protein
VSVTGVVRIRVPKTAVSLFRARPPGTARRAVFLTAFLTSLLLAPASLATRSTTGPSSKLEIYVILSDQKIGLAVYRTSVVSGIQYLEQLSRIVRGDVATFKVVNRGKQPHSFFLLGKKTKALKPGGKAQFTVSLLRRGSFPYYASTIKKPEGLKGVFTVN